MIIVELLPNRWKVGRLTLQDDGAHILLGPFAALGRADDRDAADNGNPSRDPLKPFGDTPLGTYTCRVEPHEEPTRSYGPGEIIGLTPAGGDALVAARNGRSGLLIHGGDPGPSNSMRPTHGCIRMFNDDLAKLTAMIDGQPGLGANCVVKYAAAGVVPPESMFFSSSSEVLTADIYPRMESLASMQPNPAIPAAFSVDTDLVVTPSSLTADLIKAFFQSQPDGHKGLADIAESVMKVCATNKLNATYVVAHAIWETGWGTSTICSIKNNLFGYTAYDSSPEESATSFNSRASCIEYVIPRIKANYLTAGGKYYVSKACLGNMSYGMNVHYASDSSWGAGIASVARMIERFVEKQSATAMSGAVKVGT